VTLVFPEEAKALGSRLRGNDDIKIQPALICDGFKRASDALDMLLARKAIGKLVVLPQQVD
jgi:hypothetical protein